jgi:hypothetical protein
VNGCIRTLQNLRGKFHAESGTAGEIEGTVGGWIRRGDEATIFIVVVAPHSLENIEIRNICGEVKRCGMEQRTAAVMRSDGPEQCLRR